MTYLLDTNACIRFLNDRDSFIAHRLAALPAEEALLCSIVKAELYYGAYKSSRCESNLALLERLFDRFDCLPFDDQAAEAYGRIRAQLASQGTPVGPNDLMIASIAIANNLTLVTHNTREFGRVEGLRVEDWEPAG